MMRFKMTDGVGMQQRLVVVGLVSAVMMIGLDLLVPAN